MPRPARRLKPKLLLTHTGRVPYTPASARNGSCYWSRRREAHLPAEQPRPQASSWVPRAHGDGRRPASAGRAAREGPQTALGLRNVGESAAARDCRAGRLARLNRRADFLRVAAARNKAVSAGVIVQAAPRPDREAGLRFGVTASRKVGGAVLRNRAKRRLRAAAAGVLPRLGKPATDYVLIARSGTVARPWSVLVADLEGALRRLERLPTRPRPPTHQEV
jgi:ribonuclease P protein component